MDAAGRELAVVTFMYGFLEQIEIHDKVWPGHTPTQRRLSTQKFCQSQAQILPIVAERPESLALLTYNGAFL
jgi:hypothetical protein